MIFDKITQYFGLLLMAVLCIIVWWLVVFGGKFSLHLNNPIPQIKDLWRALKGWML